MCYPAGVGLGVFTDKIVGANIVDELEIYEGIPRVGPVENVRSQNHIFS
tara:strand:- start:620 stop:766 length:147 start_codon:yes stop_codon:yes gene_type:complete